MTTTDKAFAKDGYIADATYAAYFDGTDVTVVEKLPLENAVTNWCEHAGVFAAVAHPSYKPIYFFYLQGNVLYIQSKNHPQNIYAQRMLLGSDCVSQILVQIGDGSGDSQCLHFFQRY